LARALEAAGWRSYAGCRKGSGGGDLHAMVSHANRARITRAVLIGDETAARGGLNRHAAIVSVPHPNEAAVAAIGAVVDQPARGCVGRGHSPIVLCRPTIRRGHHLSFRFCLFQAPPWHLKSKKPAQNVAGFFVFCKGRDVWDLFLGDKFMWTNDIKTGRFKIGFLLVDSHREGA